MNSDPLIQEPDDTELDLSIVNPDVAAPEPVILQASNRLAPEESLKILTELPNLDISFQACEEKAEKIVHLKDVEKQILGDGTMDVIRADVVQESFGGVYSQFPKSGFTKFPTKAGFREIKHFMGTQIATEEYALMDLFKTYVENPYNAAVAILEKIKETQYPGLIRVSESLISELQANKDRIFTNPSRNIPLGDQNFGDLTTVDLITTNFEKVGTELKTIACFRAAVQTIKCALTDEVTHGFVKTMLKKDGDNTVSMVDLTNFILDPEMLSNLAMFYGAMIKGASEVADLVQQASAMQDKPDNLAEFIIQNGSRFLSFHKNVCEVASLTYRCTLLNLAVKEMLLTYYEL